MFKQVEGIDYICNFYRYELFDKKNNHYLLTTDSSSFVFLNKQEFRMLKRGTISSEPTFNLLKEKGIVLTKKNLSHVKNTLATRYSFLQNGCSLHIVIPTARCNLGCDYCFADPSEIHAPKGDNDMSEKTAKNTVEFILNSPSKAVSIEFTGGEPLARFDLVKLMVTYAQELNTTRKKDLRFSIVTNLSLMNKEIMDFLITNEFSICTSLDGPKELHDKHRVIHANKGREIGTWDTVMHWIKTINAEYISRTINKKVYALMTITKDSLTYPKEIIDTYLELDIEIVDIRAMMFVGRITDLENQKSMYEYGDFITFYQQCLEYINSLQKKGIAIEDRMTQLYKKKILSGKPTYHTDYESPWGAGISGLTYHSNGSIYCCHEALGNDDFLLGDVTQKWMSLFSTKEMAFTIMSSLLEANPQCDRCVYKPYCATSPIENISAQSDINFRPSKTVKHHETLFHAKREFSKLLNNELRE
jgi:His-Xaa-Ser system radical SAM maturase HxsB